MTKRTQEFLYGFQNRCKIYEMREKISATDHAALAILKKTGLDVVEAAQLAHELLQASKGAAADGRGQGNASGWERKPWLPEEKR